MCAEQEAFVLPGMPLTGADQTADGIELRTPAETHPRPHLSSTPPGSMPTKCPQLLGGATFRIYPCRGEYAELIPSRRALVNALVYPLPHATGHSLGVHLTRKTMGARDAGPDGLLPGPA